ncbi:unnamed protein product [Diamesa serratosioi]
MDLCFIKDSNNKHLIQLYPFYEFTVNVDTHNVKTSQNFNISLEKIDNLIQLRLTNTNNQSQIYLCTLNNSTYGQLKFEQSLQVDFDGFVEHFVNILDSCRQKELFVSLVQRENCHILQFYEKRSFKNLVHLYLTMQEAPNVVVLYHLNQSLLKNQNEMYEIKNQNACLQSEVKKLQEKLDANENMILHRNTEEIKRLNQEIKHIETSKEYEENRLKTLLKSFEVKMDQLIRDNYSINEKFVVESKKTFTMTSELEDLKKKMNAMGADNARLKRNFNEIDGKEKKHRMNMGTLDQQVAELSEKLRVISKEKSNLLAELEAEQQVGQTKKHALKIATDELANNTEKIKNNSKQIEKYQKKVDWRNKVIFRQTNEILNSLQNFDCDCYSMLMKHFDPASNTVNENQ